MCPNNSPKMTRHRSNGNLSEQLSLSLSPTDPDDSHSLIPNLIQHARVLHQQAVNAGTDHMPVTPGKEYPTTLTRLPLFPPSQCSRRHNAEKTQVWVELPSAWSRGGVVEKSGPTLSTYDEDTLIAMIQARSEVYRGHHTAMPIPTMSPSPASRMSDAGIYPDTGIAQSSADNCACYVSIFSLCQLETSIRGARPDRGWGGRDLRRRDASINRLSAVLLRFHADLHELYQFGRGPFSLFRAEYVKGKSSPSASYYVQWEPLLSNWLTSYRSFLDFDIRRQLTPLGKAIHRFLCSQIREDPYSFSLDTMFEAIGANCDRSQSQLKYYAKIQLAKMVECGFLLSATISRSTRTSKAIARVEFSPATTRRKLATSGISKILFP